MSLNNNFAFEIDFLPVGEESKSGDAIAMRWGDASGFHVAVVDGGTQEAGERLVRHVREVYGASFINLAINSHPDGDHSAGLAVVLDNIRVDQLWMHRPWLYPQAIKHLFRNDRFTTQGLSGSIRRALDCANELEQTALKNRVSIVEPFQGRIAGPFLVLSPSQADYLKLIPHFNNTPPPRFPSPLGILASTPALTAARGIGLQPRGALGLLASGGIGALEPRGGLALIASRMAGLGLADALRPGKKETWWNETLGDDGITTEQNESSVVLYCRFNGVGVLLTGDAGHMALFNAWRYARDVGIDLSKCRYYQVPHHGSRRNVSPAILDLLLGSKQPSPTPPTRWAVASVAAGADGYPRQAVVNAFLRRGVGMHGTRGSTVRLYSGYGARGGIWGSAKVLPFNELVDD